MIYKLYSCESAYSVRYATSLHLCMMKVLNTVEIRFVVVHISTCSTKAHRPLFRRTDAHQQTGKEIPIDLFYY